MNQSELNKPKGGRKEMSDKKQITDSPCIFCNYNGAGYYQPKTHDKSCPFYKVGVTTEMNNNPRELVKMQLKEIQALTKKVERHETLIQEMIKESLDAKHTIRELKEKLINSKEE